MEHPGPTRAHRFGRAGSHAGIAVRLQSARRLRPRRSAVQPGVAVVRPGTRQVARVDRQHSRGQVPEGAGARGNSPGQGLGGPSAVVAGIAGDLLFDGTARVARLSVCAAELPRPRRSPATSRHVAAQLCRVRRSHRASARVLRTAAARTRSAIQRAGLTTSGSRRTTQDPHRSPAEHAGGSAAGVAGDNERTRADRRISTRSRDVSPPPTAGRTRNC